MTGERVRQLLRRALRLRPEEAADLRQSLRSAGALDKLPATTDPKALESILEAHVLLAMAEFADSEANALWIIRHVPDLPGCACGVRVHHPSYDQVKRAWLEAARGRGSPMVVENAAQFLFRAEPREACELVAEAKGFLPGHADVLARLLSRLYTMWQLAMSLPSAQRPPELTQQDVAHQLVNLRDVFLSCDDPAGQLALLHEIRDWARAGADQNAARLFGEAEHESRPFFRLKGEESRATHVFATALGLAHLAWGDVEAAAECLANAGDHDPESSPPSLALARQMAAAGQREAVARYLAKCRAMKLAPEPDTALEPTS